METARQGKAAALRGWGVLALALCALPARAQSVALEASAGRDYRTWSVLADVPLRGSDGAAFLTVGYGGARPSEGAAVSHQVSAGLDALVGERWLLSFALQGSPTAEREDPVLTPAGAPTALSVRSGAGQLGLHGLALFDAALEGPVSWSAEAGLGVTRTAVRTELVAPRFRVAAGDALVTLRPSAGATLALGRRWELGLRGAAYLYGTDPLAAGTFSEAQARELEERLRATGGLFVRRLVERGLLGAFVRDRLGAANAVAGIPTAPVRWELRPGVTWKPTARVRGQLALGLARYVPGQGHAQVLSTRWSLKATEEVRVWAAAALQRDVPEEAAPTRTGLLSLGLDVGF